MKRYIHFVYISLGIFLAGCTEKVGEEPVSGDRISLNGIELSLPGKVTDLTTKATITGYVVNTEDDPTNTFTGREAWELDVAIYDNGSPYVDGQRTFYWDAVSQLWVMQDTDTIFYPNYLTPQATLELHPSGWTGVADIAPDQRAAGGTALLGQDVLIQNGDPTIAIIPAHIIETEVKHAYSMLDFKLSQIDPDQLGTVTVEVGGVVYQPYQVKSGSEPEYLVIIPPGSAGPVVRLRTPDGISYFQNTLSQIASTGVNTCYCFTLVGLELLLGEITVSEWDTGTGIAGEYTSNASYPTFRGPPDTQAWLTYDTGIVQPLGFNDQGEDTTRPWGRSIVRIQGERTGITDLDSPLILRGMDIDLTEYLVFD